MVRRRWAARLLEETRPACAPAAAHGLVDELSCCTAADVRVGGRHNRSLRYLCALAPAGLEPDELPGWVWDVVGNDALYAPPCRRPSLGRVPCGEDEAVRCASVWCALNMGGSEPLSGPTLQAIGIRVRVGMTDAEILLSLRLVDSDEVAAVSRFVRAVLVDHHLNHGDGVTDDAA